MSWGVQVTVEEAADLRKLWLETFPEMDKHLKPPQDPYHKGMYIGQTLTGRLKYNTTYCAATNAVFQGLSADGTKVTLWYMTKAGIKLVNFIHDETISELKLDSTLQSKVKQIDKLMIDGMQTVIRNTPISVEGALMVYWNKNAKAVYTAEDSDTMRVWTEDIVTPDKKDPIMSLTKEEIVDKHKKDRYRQLFSSHGKKFYGWQPLGSVLN
jgi:hypothetical protein